MSELEKYPHPYVTVDLLMFSILNDNLEICLTIRDTEPFKGCYCLPGTFVHEDESAEGAVDRLLSEKLGVTHSIYTEQLMTFSDIHRDPRERVISIAYIGIIPDSKIIDEPWTKWHAITATGVGKNRLTSQDDAFLDDNLGFDHDKILRTGLNRLRGKLDYTDIVFRFLKNPDDFTARDLRSVYQAIIGKQINRGNFTKYIMSSFEENGLISKTGTRSDGPGRPADTYKYIRDKGGQLWIKS